MAVQIQVRSDSRQAQVDLKRLEASLNSVQASAASINRSISGLATATKVAFAALPIAAIGTAALRTAASFETLNARLVTATGSTQSAVSAFVAVQKIVTKTPYSVKTLTDAYARLATTGSKVFSSQAQIGMWLGGTAGFMTNNEKNGFSSSAYMFGPQVGYI